MQIMPGKKTSENSLSGKKKKKSGWKQSGDSKQNKVLHTKNLKLLQWHLFYFNL